MCICFKLHVFLFFFNLHLCFNLQVMAPCHRFLPILHLAHPVTRDSGMLVVPMAGHLAMAHHQLMLQEPQQPQSPLLPLATAGIRDVPKDETGGLVGVRILFLTMDVPVFSCYSMLSTTASVGNLNKELHHFSTA